MHSLLRGIMRQISLYIPDAYPRMFIQPRCVHRRERPYFLFLPCFSCRLGLFFQQPIPSRYGAAIRQLYRLALRTIARDRSREKYFAESVLTFRKKCSVVYQFLGVTIQS